MARLTRENATFNSVKDLKAAFVDRLNAELGDQVLRQTTTDKYINICCKYKNCPIRLTYSFTTDSAGMQTKIEPVKP